MATKKRTRARRPKTLRAAGHSMRIFSTAVGSLVNMTVTAVTSGSVLLCLFTAKRLL
jgi:hypothetical protein